MARAQGTSTIFLIVGAVGLTLAVRGPSDETTGKGTKVAQVHQMHLRFLECLRCMYDYLYRLLMK